MKFYNSALLALGRAELVVACLLVFAMILAVSTEVYYRYVLESSLYWVEEGATIAFIWVTFLGAALASKARRHINISTLGGAFRRPRGQAGWRLVAEAVVVVVAGLMAFHSYGYTALQSRTLTASLPINIPRSWMFAWPLCFGMISIALTHLYYLMDNVICLMSRLPRPAAPAVLEV